MSNSQTVPFETTLHVRDHCLCLAAQRAARALSRRFDEAFRPLALTDEGRRTLAAAVPIWHQMHAEIDAGLPDSSIKALRTGLAALA